MPPLPLSASKATQEQPDTRASERAWGLSEVEPAPDPSPPSHSSFLPPNSEDEMAEKGGWIMTTMSVMHHAREFLKRTERKRDRGEIDIRSSVRPMPRVRTGDGASDKREGGLGGRGKFGLGRNCDYEASRYSENANGD